MLSSGRRFKSHMCVFLFLFLRSPPPVDRPAAAPPCIPGLARESICNRRVSICALERRFFFFFLFFFIKDSEVDDFLFFFFFKKWRRRRKQSSDRRKLNSTQVWAGCQLLAARAQHQAPAAALHSYLHRPPTGGECARCRPKT